MKRFCVFLWLCLSATARAADGFSFEMPDPRVRIVVPDIPPIRMEVHPNASNQPHARFMGSDSTGYVVSVLTPTSDPGMTPRDCARSMARSVINRFGLDPRFVVGLETNEATFVMLFPYRVDPVIQFKAFVLSGDGDAHCVEVHISRTMPPAPEKALAEDLARWFDGFKGARIEAY